MGFHTIDALMEEAVKRFIQGNLSFEIEACSVNTRFSKSRVTLPSIKIFCENVRAFPDGARFNGNWQGSVVVKFSTYWNEDVDQDQTIAERHDERVSDVTDLFANDSVYTSLNELMTDKLLIVSDVQINGRENNIEDEKLVTKLTLDFIAGPKEE
jgi:hypothetical protein